MDTNTLTTIIINIAISGLTGFLTAGIRIGQYTNKVDNLETTVGKDDHGGLRRTVNEHSVKLASCETTLKEREPLGRRRSPLALTDRGNQFLKESGGEKFVDDNYEELCTAIEAMNPKTSYDVQENANKVIESLKNDDRLNPLKEFIFKEGMTIEDLFFVMGLHLRNKVLKNKKWDVMDIDNQKK